MRKMIVVAVITLAASVVLAATGKMQPLKARTGLWQLTQSITWTGLPPQMEQMMQSMSPTRTYKSCVKPEDLNSNPWAEGSNDNCKWTVVNSTGTNMDVAGTSCKFDLSSDYRATGSLRGKIHMLDSEHGTGSFDINVNSNGQTMHGHASYTGKWIGPTCPAGMN